MRMARYRFLSKFLALSMVATGTGAGADSPGIELDGRWESRTNVGWGNRVAVRISKLNDDGSVEGLGNYYQAPRNGYAAHCNRIDEPISGKYVRASDQSIASISVKFPAREGTTCGAVSMSLNRTSDTEFVGETASSRWTLRKVR
jgi:hypothetical protein